MVTTTICHTKGLNKPAQVRGGQETESPVSGCVTVEPAGQLRTLVCDGCTQVIGAGEGDAIVAAT